MAESRIRILDEDVASKIAAGEVVERPASVVKELVENAIDAGATRIVVEVDEGGRALIRISDNGCGMTAQETVLALQRHATSKITSAEDLAAVRTLGFRGEALPSVASVSRLTVVSRARGELEGVRIEVEAGEIKELEAIGAAEGTIITVRDLFYNTPARLKFLKTTRTELGQICDTITRLALSHPGIAFRLLADGEEVIHAPGSPDPLNTIATLYGNDLARELLAVNHTRPGLAVEGYVARPTLSRPTRSGQHFFVNGRWVRNRTLAHALDEAFRASMDARRFPFAVIHVDIDPALVDVNVHPAKAEVRFLRDWEVHKSVHDAIRQALGAGSTPPETLARQHMLRPEDMQHGSWLPPLPEPPAAVADPFAATDPGATDIPTRGGPGNLLPASAPRQGGASQLPMTDLEATDALWGGTLRPVAQLWNSYILAEGPSGLVIIDQHLAHERILFDRIVSEPEAGPARRSFPSPLTLQLPHREALVVDDALPALKALGYDLEPFGRDAFVMRSAPDFVHAGTELSALRQIVDALVESRNSGGNGLPEPTPLRVAASAACKTAVKKGARLGIDELRRLLADLARSSNPATCPHGCPIAVEVSYTELLRRFKRI